MGEILRITDGSTYVNLIRNRGRTGFHLGDWRPATSTYKLGGIWRDSPFSDGRKLVDAQWQHPIENFVLHLKDDGLNDNIRQLQDLRRLLEKANNYWKTDWQDEPVWLEARSHCETNIRYGLIYKAEITGDNNPYAQPLISKRKPIQRALTLQIERGHWLSHEPADSTCVELSAQQLDWNADTAWVVNTAQPNNTDVVYEAACTTPCLLTGDVGDIYYTTTGTAPWTNVAINAVFRPHAFVYNPHNGVIYMAGEDEFNISGITQYSTDCGASWNQYSAQDVGANASASTLVYDQSLNLLWVADSYFFFGDPNYGVYYSVPGSGVWTSSIALSSKYYDGLRIHVTSVVLQEDGAPYYLLSAGNRSMFVFPGPFYNYTTSAEYIRIESGVTCMAESSLSGLVLASASNGLYGSSNGTDWTIINSLSSFSQIVESTDGTLWAVKSASIYKSTNGGYTWSLEHTHSASLQSVATFDSVTGLAYAAALQDILESDTRTDMGRAATCNNEVYITNSRSELNLTHIYRFEDPATWSANLIPGTLPFDLFPDPVSANDAVYFGIDDSRQVAGDIPFDNLVFDLATIMLVATSITLVWEYSQGGAAWETLDVTDHTESLNHPFELGGVRSVHWVPPDGWDVETINGVDALWVRCRVSAVVGATTSVPSQQNRDIYTTIWPRVDLDELQVPGDITNLVKHTLFMQSDEGGPSGDAPNLYANRVIAGLRSIDRGEDFTAYLNCSDEQNPISIDCTLGANTAFVDWLDAAPGRASRYQPSGFDAMAMRVRFGLVSTLAAQYHGSYRAFLRCTQRVGVSGDIRVRLYISTPWGSDDYWSTTKSIPDTISYNKLIDFGEIELPLSQLISDELVATTNIELHAECTFGGASAAIATLGTWMSNRIVAPYDTAPQGGVNPTNMDNMLSKELWFDGTTLLDEFPSLYFLDLILIPSDEWIGDFTDQALSLSTAISAGRKIEIDSIDYPKTEMRGLVRDVATNNINAIYVPLTPGPANVQPNADQRLWFLLDKSDSLYTPDWNSSPHIGMSVQSRRVSRYLGQRGAR